MGEEYGCIGKPTPRQDAWDKVTGRTVYAEDMHLPGMLHGAALRSPYPHARILKVDAIAALALPGISAVLTAADLPQRLVGDCVKDMPVLAVDRVPFCGGTCGSGGGRG
jgi:xanthine dehydrogenase molybdenum-binding subunit